jgi:catechol 2,3-dioxygenase-like lactoylglutathione lyase family enzyme
MFTHFMLGSNDPEKSRLFYDATMQALGHGPSKMPAGSSQHFYGRFGSGALGVGVPADGEAATAANGGTVGLAAPNKESVDMWYAAGLANGGSCSGAPGPRPSAPGNSYGAYLRDPDGNKLCAFCQLPA